MIPDMFSFIGIGSIDLFWGLVVGAVASIIGHLFIVYVPSIFQRFLPFIYFKLLRAMQSASQPVLRVSRRFREYREKGRTKSQSDDEPLPSFVSGINGLQYYIHERILVSAGG